MPPLARTARLAYSPETNRAPAFRHLKDRGPASVLAGNRYGVGEGPAVTPPFASERSFAVMIGCHVWPPSWVAYNTAASDEQVGEASLPALQAPLSMTAAQPSVELLNDSNIGTAGRSVELMFCHEAPPSVVALIQPPS